MFDSLDERMKQDAQESSSTKERVVFWLSVTVGSVAIIGGMVYAITRMNG
jgi:hypothetical protein